MTTIDEAQRRALSAAPDDIPVYLRVVWAWLVVFDAEIVLDEGYILDGDKWIPERASVLGIIERLRDAYGVIRKMTAEPA